MSYNAFTVINIVLKSKTKNHENSKTNEQKIDLIDDDKTKTLQSVTNKENVND